MLIHTGNGDIKVNVWIGLGCSFQMKLGYHPTEQNKLCYSLDIWQHCIKLSDFQGQAVIFVNPLDKYNPFYPLVAQMEENMHIISIKNRYCNMVFHSPVYIIT